MDESIKLLAEILESLASNPIIYTIKFFESDEKIKENTKCDGSFNFKILSEDDLEQRRQRRFIGNEYHSPREDRLTAIEEKLNKLLGETEEVEESETIEDAVIGMIKDPAKLTEFIGALSAGRNLLNGEPMPQGYMGNVSRVGQNETAAAPDHGEIQNNLSHDAKAMERLAAALDTLGNNDPKIVEHLEKLATMATKNPFQFKMILTTLEGM